MWSYKILYCHKPWLSCLFCLNLHNPNFDWRFIFYVNKYTFVKFLLNISKLQCLILINLINLFLHSWIKKTHQIKKCIAKLKCKSKNVVQYFLPHKFKGRSDVDATYTFCARCRNCNKEAIARAEEPRKLPCMGYFRCNWVSMWKYSSWHLNWVLYLWIVFIQLGYLWTSREFSWICHFPYH